MVTCREWLDENISEYENRDELIRGCMRETGVSRDRIVRILKKLSGGAVASGKFSDGSVVPGLVSAVNPQDITKDFDVPTKIKDALKLLDGKVIRDSDLRVELGVDVVRWRRATDRDEFSENRLKIKKGKWRGIIWGSKKVIEDIRKTIDVV